MMFDELGLTHYIVFKKSLILSRLCLNFAVGRTSLATTGRTGRRRPASPSRAAGTRLADTQMPFLPPKVNNKRRTMF